MTATPVEAKPKALNYEAEAALLDPMNVSDEALCFRVTDFTTGPDTRRQMFDVLRDCVCPEDDVNRQINHGDTARWPDPWDTDDLDDDANWW